ncbi:hypothetical protein B0H14DRAFT_3497069 [Mycena olivaceomarginata]|nr:hypothetical protein B0H14DRAFT_3497069 [Mycena olivaceomarginata]
MFFNFFSLTALAALATTANAQGSSCPEAARFGNVNVSPSTLSPGEVIVFFFLGVLVTDGVRFRPSRRENTPTFLDYYISATATHTVTGPILIARRTYDNTTSPPIDQFTAVLPNWFYFTDATYSLLLDNSFRAPRPYGRKRDYYWRDLDPNQYHRLLGGDLEWTLNS